MPATTHIIPRDDGDPWVFNLERPKLRSLGLIAIEVTAVVLICVLGLSLEASPADVSPAKLCLCELLGCAIWLTMRKYGGGIPWMRMGVLHYLPVCLLLALVHQAANCPMLASPIKLLLVDGVAFISATLVLYKHALSKWDQTPHPAWEGFPIFWRAGPEHAAAAFSEWLKHLHWELDWQWGKAMETTEHRYGDAADLLGSEGSAAAAPIDDFAPLPTAPANPHLDPIPEEPVDGDHHLPSVDEPHLSTPTAMTATPHTPEDVRLPEGLHEQTTKKTFRDASTPTIAEEAITTIEEATTTAEEDAEAFEPTLSTPAAPPPLTDEEVATAVDDRENMRSAISHMRMSRIQGPSTPLTPPPAAAVQEEPATATSFAGNDSFSQWMNCGKDADLDALLFPRLRTPIMVQAGAVPIARHFSSTPILAPADKGTAATASGGENAITDGPATLESMGPASNDDGNAAAAEMPVPGSSSTHRHPQHTHRHPQNTSTFQGSMSEGPTTPPATPRKTPMATLRRSASSLKEKMVGVKASFRNKRGAVVTPTRDRGVFSPHTGCFTGVHSSSSSRTRVKAAAATIKRKLTPNRTNRGVWKV